MLFIYMSVEQNKWVGREG